MTHLISSIKIENFRSIKGTVTIQMDAPVVLIYGQNGTGKTSILSALELSLTGHVPSLARLDENYTSHLLHKETQRGKILTHIRFGDGERKYGEWTLSPNSMSGDPLLSRKDAHFFSERCYLAQSTLGRLLEIYEHRESSRRDSPLTVFVKELLGLDYLDSLIDGLHFAADKRRLRTTVPTYWRARENIPTLEEEIIADVNAVKSMDEGLVVVNDALLLNLNLLGISREVLLAHSNSDKELDESVEMDELRKLASLRIEISAAREEWQSISKAGNSNDLRDLERSCAEAKASLQEWTKSTGVVLNELLSSLGNISSDSLSPESTGPKNARVAAIQVIDAELERFDAVLTRHSNDVAAVSLLTEEVRKIRGEIDAFDEEMVHHASEEGPLAELLAGILQHIDENNCPVCGRDFRETSTEPLDAYVTKRIGELTESAERVRLVFLQRTDGLSALAGAERKLEERKGQQLSEVSFRKFKERQ